MSFRRNAKNVALVLGLTLLFASSAFAQAETNVASSFWEFRIGDLVMIFAVLVAPLLALQAQWYLQLRREKRERKLWLFKTLMATRGTRLAPDHVTALNSIEVEFHKETGKNREVVAAWRNYLDHLNTLPPVNQQTGQMERTEQNRWNEKQDERFISLLYRMALALDYDFDEVLLKRGFYAPKGHDDLELDQLLIRKGLLQVLGGDTLCGRQFDAFAWRGGRASEASSAHH